MKLWIGGEIHAEVADSFRAARATVERAVNEVIGQKEYAVHFGSWDCLAIIRDDEFMKEITKYSVTKKDMDFRLRVDFEAFRDGSDLDRQALIFAMLERSLALLKEKGADAGDLARLMADVKQVGVARGWV